MWNQISKEGNLYITFLRIPASLLKSQWSIVKHAHNLPSRNGLSRRQYEVRLSCRLPVTFYVYVEMKSVKLGLSHWGTDMVNVWDQSADGNIWN
jgi:hypothetical protein